MEVKPRVLVVDDEFSVRTSMRAILKKEFDVTTSDSGFKAVELIEQGEDFDVAALDIRMPGMSGIDTLQEIKKLCPTVEVLIVTAHADLDSAKNAVRFGAYDYIDKQVDKNELRAIIHTGVQRRKKTIESEEAQEKLEIAKAQLAKSERLSIIGELTASIAHELNNPLTPVIGYSELLCENDFPPEKTKSYLDKIYDGAILCQKIIQKLLAFARQDEPKRTLININEVVESALSLKERELNLGSIKVVKQLNANIPSAIADFHQIQQVFLNIINNAHHAMRDDKGSGTLTIKGESDENTIRISFSDTGPGIPDENIQKIFEPFFTTKEQGKGTGLGLSVSYGIMQEHNGNIYISSEMGKGTCFIIELPIAEVAMVEKAMLFNYTDRKSDF